MTSEQAERLIKVLESIAESLGALTHVAETNAELFDQCTTGVKDGFAIRAVKIEE